MVVTVQRSEHPVLLGEKATNNQTLEDKGSQTNTGVGPTRRPLNASKIISLATREVVPWVRAFAVQL